MSRKRNLGGILQFGDDCYFLQLLWKETSFELEDLSRVSSSGAAVEINIVAI